MDSVDQSNLTFNNTNALKFRVQGPTILPTEFGVFRVLSFTFLDNMKPRTQIALFIGQFDPNKPVLTRIHSSCLFGESFGALDCDCADQLKKSLQLISKAKEGLLIYLDQEGRGVGLECKVLAMKVEYENNVDTFTAYDLLGWKIDGRDYNDAKDILHFLNIKRIRLLTNSPQKIMALSNLGVEITEMIPLITDEIRDEAKKELRAKKTRQGHNLGQLDLD